MSDARDGTPVHRQILHDALSLQMRRTVAVIVVQVYSMSIYTCTFKPKPVNLGDGAMRFTSPYIYKGK
jgi:hypothetical protein